MEEIIQLIPFIAILLFWLIGNIRKQKKRPEPDVVLEGEEEVTLPPWGNFPMEEMPASPEAPRPRPTPREPSPQPPPRPRAEQRNRARQENVSRDAQTQPAAATARTVVGIPLGRQTFRQGIILAEILGRPKSIRRPPQ